ncbi:TPA: restriction endonuclease subunit S [Vibrio vulnificus]|uniref:Restriction endonuclease subunit S n=1 Tax=Vibrio vulnificus TaxID=672 RepID=A0A8H9K7W2_VIBVL|nr:restriction endonuclease subunit S [Vibrio vulnificus]EHU4943540.1 restriction endonuclease subunit S [Vibrio vulnificus]ELB7528396.1 restriction endonuclease subunit S [Vibrio vulnificus]ELK2276708.1 restriction endonuclease subunit S [Vibrio vulnificus]MCU8511326.1 restriction endonuclease subunit S [Vibrio vulnificus]MDS1860577.1 restriction endonuclease subunit S [Vibrio vulnificus]
MSEVENLPQGWEISKIGEVCEPSQYGYTAKAGAKGNYHYLRTTDITKTELDWDNVPFCEISEEEAKKYLLKDNDVVISRAGSIGYSYLISKAKKSVFASYLIRFRPLLNPKYFRYFLDSQQYWNAISAGSSGIAVQNVNAKTLSLIDLPIAPEKEQQRIVEKLDETFSELDAGVKELKAAQTKLSQYRQSLLKSAVEGSLTQQWRAENSDRVQETGEKLLARILKQRREQWQQQKLAEFAEKGKTPPKNWQDKYPEPVQPDTTDLPELPEGWVWATIDQLALNKRYGSSSKTNDDSSGVPVLRMGNIQDGKLDYGNLKYLPIDHKEFPELLLQDGDLLFNRTNSAELVGKTAVYRDIGKPVSYASYLISVTFSKYVLPEIVAHYINSVLGKKWIAEVMNQTAGQANVNGTKLGELAIPLAPFVEQVEIVQKVTNEFESIDQQSEATTLGLKQSEAQRKNILKSAFSGKLVPQDPNDEPASVLLEKIKQEREALAKKPKTKQRKTKSAMKKITVEELTKWVSDYEGNSFTFGELQKTFQGDYDQLKDCVFEILSAKEPILKQVFDQKLNAITFIKEDK